MRHAGGVKRVVRRRGGYSALEIVTVMVSLATFLGIASMVYSKHQETVYQRICHQQQRTLQGAIESLPSADVDVPVDQLFAQLVAARLVDGTLAGPTAIDEVKLTDPGFGPNSFRNYLVMPGSKMVGCRNHGSPFSEF